jgi:precorrin-3B synthase
VGQALERALAEAGDLTLPEKFGFAIDGGACPLGETVADIAIRTDPTGCHVALAGARRGLSCGPGDAPAVAIALARAFPILGGTRRMRELVALRGETTVDSTMAEHAPTESGQLTHGELSRLADQAERSGDGLLRITPWRSVLIVAVEPSALAA